MLTFFKSLSSGSPVRPVGILGAISTSIRSKTVQKKKGPAVTSKKGEVTDSDESDDEPPAGKKPSSSSSPPSNSNASSSSAARAPAPLPTRLSLCLEALRKEYSTLQAGRPSLDHITVAAHGSNVSLKTISSITQKEGQSLLVSLFDSSLRKAVETAIKGSGLGLTVAADSDTALRVTFPKVTSEARALLAKRASKIAEESVLAVRRARKDALDAVKAEGYGKDDERREEAKVQKLIDEAVKKIKELSDAKEAELMGQPSTKK